MYFSLFFQTPCGQTGRIDFNKRPDLRMAGGGFGPVSIWIGFFQQNL